MNGVVPAVRPDLPSITTSLPGPRARAIIARDHRVLSPSYTRPTRWSPRAARAPSSRTSTATASSISTPASRWSPPATATRGWSRPSANRPGSSSTCPAPTSTTRTWWNWRKGWPRSRPAGVPQRVYFGNSGAEAVEAAIKLARYHTGRDKFIAFLGGFHGRTMGALSLTGPQGGAAQGLRAAGAGRVPHSVRLLLPLRLRQAAGDLRRRVRQGHRGAVFQDRSSRPRRSPPSCSSRCRARAATSCRRGSSSTNCGALAAKHGILLVVDEVQSGMGRTGRMWASEHFDFVPDIMAVAKGIASGMPLSATIARAELMQWEPGAHASTFGGNPVSVAAALATIELLEEELVENAARMGAYMHGSPARVAAAVRLRRRRARPRADDRHRVGADQRTRERAPELRDRVVQTGLRARPAGARRRAQHDPAVARR